MTVLKTLRMPDMARLRNAAVAGLVVGIIALPLSIALAVAVGVPPIAGLAAGSSSQPSSPTSIRCSNASV